MHTAHYRPLPCFKSNHINILLHRTAWTDHPTGASLVHGMQVVKQYVCGPNAEGQPGCGHAFTSFTIMGLTATQRGLLRCNVCDFGIVEPKIDGKSAASWRLDRDIARSQRKVLKEVLQPLQEMVARLEAVDPPDFGSFTDWVTARASSTAGPGAGGGALPLHHLRCCAALWRGSLRAAHACTIACVGRRWVWWHM